VERPTVDEKFAEVQGPFGENAPNFFLAASLYHARKVSFERAAHLAGLSFQAFQERLIEHFGKGFVVADEAALEDIETVKHLP